MPRFSSKKSRRQFSPVAILQARCPSCRKGAVTQGMFRTHKRCPVCEYNFYPESGYYLGAMVVSYLITALLTIPTLILLKLNDVDLIVLLTFPFLQFLVVGPILMFYAKIIWL